MDNKEVWKLGLDIDEINNDSVKATYDNAFCMDTHCIHYFEDSCMEAMAEKGTEIEPFNIESFNNGIRESKDCKEFIVGTFLQYVVDLGEDE